MVVMTPPPKIPPRVQRSTQQVDQADIRSKSSSGAAGAAVAEAADDTYAVERLTDGADSVLTKVGMAGMLAPMAGSAVGAVAGGLGRLTGSQSLKGASEKISGGMKRLNEVTIGELTEKAGVGGVFTKVTQPVANVTASVVDKLAGWTGISRRRAEKHLGKAAVAHSRAQSVVGQMNMAHLDHLPESFREPVQQMHDLAKGAATHGAIDKDAFQRVHSLMEEAKLGGVKLNTEGKALLKQAHSLKEHLGNAVHHDMKSTGWRNVKESVRNAPATFAKSSAMHTVVNGAFAASSMLSMVKDTMSFSHSVETLKQMYADMTGTKAKDVSTMRILLGSVPPPIADVRGKLMKNFVVKQGVDIANVGLMLATRMGFAKVMASQMGVMAVSGVADSLLDTSVIPMYKAFTDAQKKGMPISAGDYAAFIGTASRDLKARGGADSEFARALGEQYAAEKTSAAQMLNEITDGKMMVRLHGIIDANKAKMAEAAAAKPTHTDRLNGTAAAQQPVVGQHTAALDKQAQANALGTNQRG